MFKPSKFQKAFAYLCSLINDDGYELTQASVMAAREFGVSSSALQSEFHYQSSLFCSPSALSGVAPVVVTPAAPTPRDCAPSAMSGDAWESAALHVIAQRVAPAPVPCLFPQPEFKGCFNQFTGDGSFSSLSLRPEFWSSAIGASIDATDRVPTGSTELFLSPSFGRFTAHGHVCRPC